MRKILFVLIAWGIVAACHAKPVFLVDADLGYATLTVDYIVYRPDDPFAEINGVEVHRSDSMPTYGPIWNTLAGQHESSNAEAPFYEMQDVSTTGIPELHNGTNVLAIGVWNATVSSSDLVVVPRLSVNETESIVRGPYLQLGTPTSIVVRWRTNIPTDGRVAWGSQHIEQHLKLSRDKGTERDPLLLLFHHSHSFSSRNDIS